MARLLLLLASVSKVFSVCVILFCGLSGCGQQRIQLVRCNGGVCEDPLQISELMARNDGAWVDGDGETDDWLELINTGDESVSLRDYAISDGGEFVTLPRFDLEPGEVVVLWADNQESQGRGHLPFKLSSGGETISLVGPGDRLVDEVTFPALEPNESFARFPDGDGGAFQVCHWASPARVNGQSCGPPPPPGIPERIEFDPYSWPDPWPEPPTLAISELALRPAGFVEIQNLGDQEVALADVVLTLAPHAPGLPWPDIDGGVAERFDTHALAPGGYAVIELSGADVAQIAATAQFEGVATLWQGSEAADRVDFMAWPEGAALTRKPEGNGFWFCAQTTRGASNDACDPLQSRPVQDRLRHMRTPSDFAALAEGGVALGMEAVKFILDMEGGDAVHFLSSASWDLHYTFVRELIENMPHLDRCDPTQNSVFHDGWVRFSQQEYFSIESRRYLLGTLVRYSSNNLHTMEFTTGDRIIGSQMTRSFFGVASHLQDPALWYLRPQSGRQVDQMESVEGTVPIVDPDAPFRDVTMQPLTEGLAYGVLTYVPASELDATALGPQVIVVTDQVPNDIPLVGGLITEAFQTPLSHVNILSRNRGTPNMSLRDARSDPQVAPLLDRLVRLEVHPFGFEVTEADPEEAEAFWEERATQGDPLRPALDTTVRGVQLLQFMGVHDLAVIGAKAAQLAELALISSREMGCLGRINTPENAFAIPVVHFLEHLVASGAAARLESYRQDPEFRSDPRRRAELLAELRAMIMSHPVDPELLQDVTSHVESFFGEERVRFRSSSNTEDLEGFNGAGLYTSISAQRGDPDRAIDDAIRTVWASIYNARAYDERRYFNVDEPSVAMGVLVHEAFLSERANGVAISRNILNPIRSDQYYINSQVGEASVTNPAPGVTTEQLIYRARRSPRVIYQAQSSLPGGAEVLDDDELEVLACTLGVIHNYFWPLLDPTLENRWFAMDIEFKLIGFSRTLLIKQARPYTFGNPEFSEDCREF